MLTLTLFFTYPQRSLCNFVFRIFRVMFAIKKSVPFCNAMQNIQSRPSGGDCALICDSVIAVVVAAAATADKVVMHWIRFQN